MKVLELLEATQKSGAPDDAHGGYQSRHATHKDGSYVTVFFDEEFDIWRALKYSEQGDLEDFADFKGDTPKSKAKAEKWATDHGYIFEALLEARNPALKYTETKVKDKLDKVMVTLEGNESAGMTRLLNRYARLDKTMKSMIAQRDKVNDEVRTEVEALFNAEDEVLSRVVETLSATVMLTKAQKAATKEKKKTTDFEAIVRDLTAAVPDLQKRIEELTTKYTKFEEPTDTVSKVQIKPHVKEGVLDGVRGWGTRFLNAIKQWAAGFDKNLDSIKARIAAL